MVLSIRSAHEVAPATFHALLQAVYAQGGYFAESLDEKYPDGGVLADSLADLASRPGAQMLVVAESGGLLGYLFLTPRKPQKLAHTADLSMGVHPSARGRGVGRALLDAMLARVQAPLEIIYLMVRADHEAALHLYRAAGFEWLARLDGDIRIGNLRHDGVLMRLKVRPRSV